MTEHESIDAIWQRERRRVGIRAGIAFGATGVVLRVIQQAGLLEAFGVEGGPFTVRWVAALLGGAIVGAGLFGYAVQWTVKPPADDAR